MNSELSRTELSCLITHKKGFSFKSKDYISSGVPVVRVSNFTWDSISTDDLRYVSHEVAISNKVVQLNEDDVIVATVGSWPQNPASTVGKVVKVPHELSGALLNQNTVKLRVIDENPINQKYLYIALKTKEFSDHLISKAQGSANQASITLSDIFSYAIPWGTYPQRKYIVDVIDSINSKTVIVNQINKTLEKMAQALFKSWFVDFEPVKAKVAVLEAGGTQEDATLAAMTAISGKDADALKVFESEYPEQYAELKATLELFPSAMQDSEMGEIPEGWRHGPLSSIATFANGKVDVCSLTPESYISTENMLENRAGISTASSLPSVNSVPEFRCGHVLISNIRPYFKKIWLARFKGGRSADVLAFEARDSITVEYVYNLLYQETFFNFMMLTSKGVKMPRGDKKAIMGWQCVLPDKKVSNVFSKAVSEYYSFIEINNAQNKTLTQLRDILLPKLLSGEITLPEAEQAASEVENV
ncbi:restriction endonuclease subunit S [Serratia fonticola]|uniref:restriction endonuclease subunit S n=1 Tax=Serratia fonticola TaxID=47917 RepID=UPI00217B4B45|nr:restriction endonuclease subunit S [Serratia fonticola]CAI0943629.1 EcoKI restriction-modification system protein HsdS [Serratia fonticola]